MFTFQNYYTHLSHPATYQLQDGKRNFLCINDATGGFKHVHIIAYGHDECISDYLPYEDSRHIELLEVGESYTTTQGEKPTIIVRIS